MLLILAVAVLGVPASAQTAGNVAYRDANVRITMIDDGAARLEYAPNGKFVDDKSQVAVIRDYAPVSYKVSDKSKTVRISTNEMTITYVKGKGPFTSANLSIVSAREKGTMPFSWKPGLKDAGNLKGTYRTLDGYDGNLRDGKPMPIEDGLLSKSGWTLINDSKSYLFDRSEWPWVEERPDTARAQDWYFLAYGHDYKKALRMFTKFAGKVPLPPRYAFGYCS